MGDTRSDRQIPALLVSVRNASEARQAILGGCDILDVKEPSRGSLGMADAEQIAGVLSARDDAASDLAVSVALGEAADWLQLSAAPARLDWTGVAFAKLGTARLGIGMPWSAQFDAARAACEASLFPEGAAPWHWVAVAYADHQCADAPAPTAVIDAVAEIHCHGVLIDTWDKRGGSLLDWLDLPQLQRLAQQACERGVWLALAGKVKREDLGHLREVSAAIIGIRSAACLQGQRDSAIDPQAIAEFRQALWADIVSVLPVVR
ncbi:MAG: (5-formylfuran-3-yl)methyl phosphate synthase [Planctomycetales bacterium]